MAYNNGFPMGYQQMYPQYYPSPTAPATLSPAVSAPESFDNTKWSPTTIAAVIAAL